MFLQIKILAVALIIGFFLGLPIPPGMADDASLSPVLNKGRKWRIGYYEGGPYINYPANLKTIAAGLAELGWMAPLAIPEMSDANDSKAVWDYLVGNVKSQYIEFAREGYWSAQWSKKKRTALKHEVIDYLNGNQRIDFMIAMGTWAGQDLSNNQHTTPTMAVSVSDPVRSGMSATAKDSGIDHFHAKCDPTRYIRQLRLFHRLVKFKTLGVVYDNSVEGRTYAAYDDIIKVSKERNFKVRPCHAPFSDVDRKTSTDRIIQCHNDLAKEVDAVFVTVHRGIDSSRMRELTAPFLENKIPTWSQRGSKEVKNGVLFSISRGGFKAVGRFHAKVMAKVFNGRKPRNINQVFEDPKLISVNIDTAERINFDIPKSVLKIADEVYETIAP